MTRTDEGGTVISELEWDADADCPWAEGYLRRIKSQVSVDGSTTERTFNYDYYGRLASSVLALDDGSPPFRVDRRFDEFGRLAELRHGGPGPRIVYQHDGVGALSQILVGDAPVWTATSHDVSGAVDGIDFGNGLHEERSYHVGVLEWLTLLADQPVIAYPGSTDASTVVDSVSLEYDGVGRMLRKEIPHLGVEESYVHDNIGRLRRVDYSHDGQLTAEMVHTYSPIGSVMSRSGVGSFAYGDPQRPLSVTAAGSVSYAYDTNGRQIDRNGAALTWNAWSKLDRVQDGADLHVENAYDGYGKKVRRTEYGPEPSVTYFADGLDLKIEGDQETRRYRVSGPEGVVAVVVQSAGTEELLYVHGNEMGSTSVFTNHSGDVVERQDFDPFGRRRAPLGGAAIWSGDSEVDIGFTGHRREESFGLMDMGGRYYDPHLARFAGPDPFVSAPTSSQGYDPFSYVRNDPLTYTDPSGYVPVPGEAGDWDSGGWDENGIWWFSCNEGCDADVVGVSADSIIEAAGADPNYHYELLWASKGVDSSSPASRLADREVRRRNERLSHRASVSPTEGTSLAGEIATEVAYDMTPGVGTAHDLDGLREAVNDHRQAPSIGAKVHVGLAAVALVPGLGGAFKVIGRRFADAIHLGANFGSGTTKKIAKLQKRTDTVYRGVHANHPALPAAKEGRAVPGNADNHDFNPDVHNAGYGIEDSPFTAWTRDPEVAVYHATKEGPGGVVLEAKLGAPSPGSTWSWEWSRDIYREGELFLRGVRENLGVHWF